MTFEKKEFKFGDGKISGAISFFLATLSLLGVFCFHYPEYLTTPELRAFYSVPALRSLLAFSIFTSFTLGIVSFVLSRDRRLSTSSLVINILSLMWGGSTVQTPDKIDPNNYLGLDWFILDILIVAILFIPVEKMFHRIEQKIFRKDWKTDFYHFLFSHLLIQGTSFLILLPSLYLGSQLALPQLQHIIQEQPLFMQFLQIMILADLTQYWIHRSFHQVPWLWKFHSIHHSIEEMDWFAGSRLHLVDIVITRGLTLLPLFVLGFKQEALQAYLVFIAFWATFLHVNIKYQFTTIQKFYAMPIFHHWHHADDPAAYDKNFAVHFPMIDQIFKTYYLPENQWPKKYGTSDKQIPHSYWQQTIYPFKR